MGLRSRALFKYYYRYLLEQFIFSIESFRLWKEVYCFAASAVFCAMVYLAMPITLTGDSKTLSLIILDNPRTANQQEMKLNRLHFGD